MHKWYAWEPWLQEMQFVASATLALWSPEANADRWLLFLMVFDGCWRSLEVFDDLCAGFRWFTDYDAHSQRFETFPLTTWNNNLAAMSRTKKFFRWTVRSFLSSPEGNRKCFMAHDMDWHMAWGNFWDPTESIEHVISIFRGLKSHWYLKPPFVRSTCHICNWVNHLFTFSDSGAQNPRTQPAQLFQRGCSGCKRPLGSSNKERWCP